MTHKQIVAALQRGYQLDDARDSCSSGDVDRAAILLLPARPADAA